ncbi:MAG TPA: 50S ribosomal protein L9 [Candidatus Paceibacterota bacterium]
MKVILLKNVPKLGKKDDVVEVNQGYAANALFPSKLAMPATDVAIANSKARTQHKVAEKEIQHNLLDRAIGELEGKALVYKAKANEKGSLFSKVDVADISAELLKQYRIAVDAKLMKLEGAPIKQAGTYVVEVVDGKYKSSFSVDIIGE